MRILWLYGLLCLGAVVMVSAGCATGPSPAPTSTQPAGQTPPAALLSAPAWQVGDHWVYDWTSGEAHGTKALDVVALRDLNGVQYYVVQLDDAQHYYTRALHWAAAVRDGKVEARMVPPLPWFVWPLVSGAHWTHQGRFEQREGVSTYNGRFSVTGAESVEVPAGRFEAIRIVRETDRGDRDEYWYSPDVRWYARWLGRRGDTQFEESLREYRPVQQRH